MSMEQEILTALRAVHKKNGPLIHAREGLRWQHSLQRTLGGEVADKSHYAGDRVYCLDIALPVLDDKRWRTTLRIRISGAGPFVMHTFLLRAAEQRWWTGVMRVSRNGFHKTHADLVHHLRAWYQDQGLKEVDADTQALVAPTDLRLPGVPEQETVLYRLLFGS